MCLLKTGLLFVASEFGNHTLFQVNQLGDNEDEPVFSTLSPPEQPFEFSPRALLNLVAMDDIENLAPITACKVADLANDDSPQLYAACGRGPRSSIRALRHGLEVTQWAVTKLPGNPTAVWTVKQHVKHEFDSYIVVSFTNATLVLSIGETVEEVSGSGFLETVPTLSASRLGDDALIQVYPHGIRHIRADQRVSEWKAPGGRTIVQSAVNERQVAIALAGGEIVYFEMDESGQLNEYTERHDMEAEVTSMAIPPVPPGLKRSRFLGVGCADSTVRVVSLDPSDCLTPMSMQALPAMPESLCVVEMAGGEGEQSTLYMNIGLENGVLLRTEIDSTSGDLSDTRTRYLGSRAVKLFSIKLLESEAVLALSSRPWISYNHQGHSKLTPLSYDMLDHACSFQSEQCPEGIVACSRDTLRLLSLERLGTVFNSTHTPLPRTPRDFMVDEEAKTLIVVGGDHNVVPVASGGGASGVGMDVDEGAAAAAAGGEGGAAAAGASGDGGGAAAAGGSAPSAEPLTPEEIVLAESRAGAGKWIGDIRVIDPLAGTTLSTQELEPNEVPISVCGLEFASVRDGSKYVVIGTVTDWDLKTQKFSACHLNTYKMVANDGTDRKTKTELVHRTEIDGIPAALHAFNGRLLAGIGALLRLYEFGKRKLLRKCENKQIPNTIVDIKSIGHRVLVSDLRESYFWIRYKMADNQLVIFADDANSRWLTESCMLDYSTCAGVDKFGNFNVSRLPEGVTDDIDEDPTGSKTLWERGSLGGASQKVETMASYHMGETALSLQRATLAPGGSECMVYTTLSGGVGVFLPFTNKEDVDFFQHLEMHLRQENTPLCGRDHLSYRSAYFPVKNVVDGDLCEQYNSLDAKKKRSIAEDLDRTPSEVSKKLEDIRNRYAF
jgi:splicing factor 3B subunit 3